MRTRLGSSAVVLSGAAAVLIGALSLAAQETPAPKPDAKAPKAKRTVDASRRVPNLFGEVGLTTDQKESIYKIRAKHQTKIADLEKQLAAARKDELSECETVLNDTQKQLLAQHRKVAAEAKAAAKKKAAAAKEAAKKDSAKSDSATGK